MHEQPTSWPPNRTRAVPGYSSAFAAGRSYLPTRPISAGNENLFNRCFSLFEKKRCVFYTSDCLAPSRTAPAACQAVTPRVTQTFPSAAQVTPLPRCRFSWPCWPTAGLTRTALPRSRWAQKAEVATRAPNRHFNAHYSSSRQLPSERDISRRLSNTKAR